MVPELIAGRYRVLRPIGRGAMGSVWLCTDEVLGREVAVKQVGLFFDESATDTARALREARNTAALNHPNVVSVFNVVEQDGDVWLVMEHVPSRTLSEVISADGRLAPERAARIGAQVAEGLAAAHALGTIHRDVKPSNILVADDDHAKIGDFGIARGRDDPQLTQTGLVTGTPAYFSPELARGGAPGPESDVWALGATLYAAVEGRPPYSDGGNALGVLQVIAHQRPPSPEHAGVLTEPIARMMDPDGATRWTMADAAQVLRKVAAEPVGWDTGTSALPSPSDRTLEPPAPAPTVSPSTGASTSQDQLARSRKGLVVVAVAALLLLVSAAVGITLLGDGGGERSRRTSTQAGGCCRRVCRQRSVAPASTRSGARSRRWTPRRSRLETEESTRPSCTPTSPDASYARRTGTGLCATTAAI